jgi:hypothetical protein
LKASSQNAFKLSNATKSQTLAFETWQHAPMQHQQDWNPESWKTRPVAQPIVYDNEQEKDNVLSKLTSLPPLVSPFEVTYFSKRAST